MLKELVPVASVLCCLIMTIYNLKAIFRHKALIIDWKWRNC